MLSRVEGKVPEDGVRRTEDGRQKARKRGAKRKIDMGIGRCAARWQLALRAEKKREEEKKIYRRWWPVATRGRSYDRTR